MKAKDDEDHGDRLLALIEDRDLWKQSEETCSRQYDKLAARCERMEKALRQCAEAPFSGWTIAQAIARAALSEETGE